MQPRRILNLGAWIITAVFASTNTWAGTIALADAPLVTGLSKTVAPNILFILDDSGSMNDASMPDGVENNSSKNCFRNWGYNTIYYNPATTYSPPVDSTGTAYGAAGSSGVFTAVKNNGFDSGSSTTNLTSETTTYGSQTSGQISLGNNPIATANNSRTLTVTHTAHGRANGDSVVLTGMTGTVQNVNLANLNGVSFVISVVNANSYRITFSNAFSRASGAGTGGGGGVKAQYTYTVVTGSVPDHFYANYTSAPTAPPSTCSGDGNADYTRVNFKDLSATDKQNYANWFSYYRTRLLMMKTAAGRAFSKVTNDYRVGFTVISDSGTGSSWLGVGRFNATQKQAWYEKLYGAGGTGYTPLRAALSKAGRYYAGNLVTGNEDPVQYSCQQNFTILTTDGYWNTNAESSTYGPKNMTNSANVGDQDSGSDVLPPYLDALAKSNTLADVAMYYYKNDLRPSSAGVGGLTDEGTRIDVTEDNVPPTGNGTENHQRMVTFTLGLGVDGTLAYPTALDAIKQGTTSWPDPITNSAGQRIDDLWHAAINGRGQYLSAKNANAVEAALSSALKSIEYVQGASSAAATSNLQPIQGDNTAFIAQYETGHWVGDVLARSIDVGTGAIGTTNLWSAQAKIDAQRGAATDTRNIYTFSAAATNKLKTFVPANFTNPEKASFFNTALLTQYTNNIWTSDQRTAATSDKLINYLRGQTGNENTGATPGADTDLFRQRRHALGDISSSAPVYVRKPVFAYIDSGYTSFVSARDSRSGTVYVGANDGMLHAINASTNNDGTPTAASGTERWAYIPSMVLPNLYRLADGQYAGNHRFYVDGPITVGDAYNSGAGSWATILVGGLGHGGKGYYALNVTDPDNPVALWEFTSASDSDMGYSYGNPLITKRASDGRWVVIFASGYNNGGAGRLFVVDAFTGAMLSEIPTDEDVTDENLSGIAKISNYVEDGLKNNSTQWVYGGDLSGNLWRFDINNDTRLLLGKTSATPGAQPITLQPELGRIRDGAGNWHRVIYFGTGRALGPNDLSATDASYGVAQAVYAVKDTDTSLGVLTDVNNAKLVEQNLVSNVTPRKIDPVQTVDWQLQNGWYVTVPVGERFHVDPGLQLGTLAIAANIAEQGYCNPTGKSVLYQFNYKSGNVLTSNEYQAQIVGITQLQTQGGSGPVVIDPVFADGTTGNTNQISTVGGTGGTTRVSWREIE